MRTFNTSGPNNPEKHYTVERKILINKGKTFVVREAGSFEDLDRYQKIPEHLK